VQLLIGGREREEQRLDPEHLLEQRRGRKRARHHSLQHPLAGVHRLQRRRRRADGGMARRDSVGGHPRLVGAHRDAHARRGLRGDVRDDGLDHPAGILAGDQAAGHVSHAEVRDHRVLPTARHAVDLERRPFPQSLERAEPGLPVRLGQPERAEVLRLVEGDGGDLAAALGGQFGNAVVEAADRDRAVRAVQAGHDRAERVQRVGHRPAVPPGVQVGVGALDHDVHRDQALGRHRHRRLGRPPHGPVRGDDQVGRQLRGVGAHERRQVRAADLLLALEQELHVEREAALLGQEGLGDLENDVDRTLVVGRAPAAHHVAVCGQLERRTHPLGQVAGGLHVVVPVDQDGRRTVGAEPVAPDHRMAVGLLQAAAGEGQLPGQPSGGGAHGLVGGVPADARHRHVLAELAQVAGVAGVKGKHCRRQSR
jgi:hypothetical protein